MCWWSNRIPRISLLPSKKKITLTTDVIAIFAISSMFCIANKRQSALNCKFLWPLLFLRYIETIFYLKDMKRTWRSTAVRDYGQKKTEEMYAEVFGRLKENVDESGLRVFLVEKAAINASGNFWNRGGAMRISPSPNMDSKKEIRWGHVNTSEEYSNSDWWRDGGTFERYTFIARKPAA